MKLTFEEEYDPIDIEDYLAHYGRKGMKWYEHIFGKLQSHAKYNKDGKTETSKSNKKEKKSKSYKKLSDEDLKKRIERAKLEKEYLDLTKDTRSNGKRLVKRALDLLEDSGFNIVKGSVENIGKQYVTYWLGSQINKLAKAEIVNPKKGQKDK